MSAPDLFDILRASWLLVSLLCASIVPSATAQSVVIESLQQNGVLRFKPGDGNLKYAIEWAPTAVGPWYSDWTQLQNITTNGSPVLQLEVPMFYRVRAVTNTEPRNLVLEGSTGHNNEIEGVAAGNANGSHDGDDSTGTGAYRLHTTDGSATAQVTSTHTWDTPVNLLRIRTLVGTLSTISGNFPRYQSRFEIWVRQGKEWSRAYQQDTGELQGPGATDTREILLEKSWAAVTGIRVLSYCSAYSFSGNREQEATATVYEIEAWGI